MKIYIGFAIDMDGAYNNKINSTGQIIPENHNNYKKINEDTNIFINGMNKLFNYFDQNNNNSSATWFVNEAGFKTSELYPDIIKKCITKGELGLHTHFDGKALGSKGKCIISKNKNDWFEKGLVIPTKKLRKISNKYNKPFFVFKAGCHLRSDEMFDSLGKLDYIYDTTMVYEDTVYNEDGTMRFDDTKLMCGTLPFFITTKNGYRLLELPEIRPIINKIKKHIDNTPNNAPIFIRLQVHPFDVMRDNHLEKFDQVIKYCNQVGIVEFKNTREMGLIYIDYLLNKFAEKMTHKYNNLLLNDTYYVRNNKWWEIKEVYIIKYIFENYNNCNLKILDCFGGFGQVGIMLRKLGYNNISVLDFGKERIQIGLKISKEENLNIIYINDDFYKNKSIFINDIFISVNSFNKSLDIRHDEQIDIYNKLLKNNCILYFDISRYGEEKSNYKIFDKLVNKNNTYYKKSLKNNFIEIKMLKKKSEKKKFSDFFYEYSFIHQNNYNSYLYFDEKICQEVIKILFLNSNIKPSSGLYFPFTIKYLSENNYKLPIKKYKLEFKCKVNKFHKNFRLRVYTGIKYVIINKEIKEEYNTFYVEDKFDFNKSSTYRIAFINPEKDLELYFKDPILFSDL